MATGNPIHIDGSKLAASSLTSNYGYAVKLNSSRKVALCATAGELPYGILHNKPAADEAAQVVTSGRVQAILAGTTAVGDLLATNASGKLAVTADGRGGSAIAVALEAGSADELREVYVMPHPARSVGVLSIPVNLATVADGNVVTGLTMGFAGEFTKMDFIVTNEVTTANKATSLNIEIATVDVTGGVVALTSANCATLGAKVAGSAILAGGAFGASDAIDIEAASTTAFAEGEGVLLLFWAAS